MKTDVNKFISRWFNLPEYDFTTWDEKKYAFVKEVLWQKNGKFISLDHQIPLGNNGISLSQY